jgi:hypothetical protein
MGTCIACGLFERWQLAADGYAVEIGSTLSPYAMPFLVAVLAFFWTLRITRYIGGAEMDVAELGKEIVMTTIASTFLTFPYMWSDLVHTLLDSAVDLALFLIDPNGTLSRPGIIGLIAAVDTPLNWSIQGARAMMNGTGLTEIGLFIGAFILFCAYFALWFFILIDAIWFYTKFVFLQVLGPILLVAMATPATRGTMVQAYKIFLTAILQFASLGIILGLARFMLELAAQSMPIGPDGSVTGDASDYLFGADYLTALACAGLLIFLRGAFHTLAARLADSVTDSAPINQAASVVKNAVGRFVPTSKPKS